MFPALPTSGVGHAFGPELHVSHCCLQPPPFARRRQSARAMSNRYFERRLMRGIEGRPASEPTSASARRHLRACSLLHSLLGLRAQAARPALVARRTLKRFVARSEQRAYSAHEGLSLSAFRMTTRTDLSASPLIEGRDDLLAVFSGGEKPRDRLADRHRAREVRLSPRRPSRAVVGRAGRHPRPAARA